MELKYFKDCKTVEEVTTKRNELAKINHSDWGGDDAIMAEINREAEVMKNFLAVQNSLGDGFPPPPQPVRRSFSERLLSGLETIKRVTPAVVDTAQTLKPLAPLAIDLYSNYKKKKNVTEKPIDEDKEIEYTEIKK
jgi:hypothetical protein